MVQSDLSFATMEELIQELASRTDSFILAYRINRTCDTELRQFVYQDLVTALGLARYAQERILLGILQSDADVEDENCESS